MQSLGKPIDSEARFPCCNGRFETNLSSLDWHSSLDLVFFDQLLQL